MAQRTPRILIVVEGGIVQTVMADTLVDVLIKDWDNIKDGSDFDPASYKHVKPVPSARLQREAREGTDFDPFGKANLTTPEV